MTDEMAALHPLRAALIVDGSTLPSWAMAAIANAVSRNRIQLVVVFKCTNNVTKKCLVKNFCYYAMRTLLVRPDAWKPRALSNIVSSDIETISFAAVSNGQWQRVPASIIQQGVGLNLDVVIKFGMGLMQDPHSFPSRYGVVSYHHGDPLHYRGRPAGFYELYDDAPYVGAIVQRLTNRLDGGEILAKGHYRIERHSYRHTLESLYSGSACLLDKALSACIQMQPNTIPAQGLGKNYRLPDNFTMAKFSSRLLQRKIKRLALGAFWRKDWKIFEINEFKIENLTDDMTLRGHPMPLGSESTFLADPFYLDQKGSTIVCERMPKHHLYGQIARINAPRDEAVPLLAIPGSHLSYPHVVHHEGRVFLLPEVAEWSGAVLMEIAPTSGALIKVTRMKGLESERILDPTLFFHEDVYWLFATPQRIYRKMDTLMLWSSTKLEGPYEQHPLNPIVSNPATARSAGRIISHKGRLLRFGQNNTGAYGARLSVMEIEEISQKTYRERQVGSVQWEDHMGPHTIDFSEKGAVLDGYGNVFSFFAWVPRIRSKWKAK